MDVRLFKDDSEHSHISALKTSVSDGKTISELFVENSHRIGGYTNGSPLISITETNLSESNTKFIGIGIYHLFEASGFSNLLNRVRLFNLSNYYNANEIIFKPDKSSGNWIEVITSGEGEEETSVEKVNFLMSTDAFSYEEISMLTFEVAIEGNECTYYPVAEKFGEFIKISLVLSSNNTLLSDCGCKASIKVSVALKSGIKYKLPFNINLNGDISNIS
jgi:hypothetical protein